MRLSLSAYAAIKSKARKARRIEKALESAFIADALGDSPKRFEDAHRTRVRARSKPSARKRAFARLKALCHDFAKIRAKRRNGGRCEVAMACRGLGAIEVAYHVFPAAMGNAIKYDPRNILGACASCNGSEYFARKRGDDAYVVRHASILGEELFKELEALQGRKKISTPEAVEMADEYHRKIAAGEWV